jgi:NAD-dependent deacetylase
VPQTLLNSWRRRAMIASMSLKIADYSRVVFFTGAGLSAASGVPTYRGKGGIWKSYDYESCACQEAFDRDPEYVWEFHNYRRSLVAKCEPTEGHRLIAHYERATPSACIVTQNIDGLHQRAGSSRVHELHGSLWQVRCDNCGYRAESHDAPLSELRCPQCEAYKRPNIVWFGDSLFPHVLQAVDAVLQQCDLLISIGTSAQVYPAAQMPLVAKRAGATLVEINPEETPLSHAYTHHYRTSADEALRELFAS